jgi:hypothetical protein
MADCLHHLLVMNSMLYSHQGEVTGLTKQGEYNMLFIRLWALRPLLHWHSLCVIMGTRLVRSVWGLTCLAQAWDGPLCSGEPWRGTFLCISHAQ